MVEKKKGRCREQRETDRRCSNFVTECDVQRDEVMLEKRVQAKL